MPAELESWLPILEDNVPSNNLLRASMRLLTNHDHVKVYGAFGAVSCDIFATEKPEYYYINTSLETGRLTPRDLLDFGLFIFHIRNPCYIMHSEPNGTLPTLSPTMSTTDVAAFSLFTTVLNTRQLPVCQATQYQ